MARPREFDEKVVLEAAVQQFWRYGYEATSVRDLADRMGITGASLYNAFGGKRSLYRLSLEHYLEQTFQERINRLETQYPPREALTEFFEEIIERSLSDRLRRGCMLVNSALEIAPHDPEFQKVVARFLTQVEAFFLRCVVAGQKDGAIAKSQSAQDMARLLLGVLLGIRVLARSKPDRKLLEGLARPAFAMLGNRKSIKRGVRANR
jgi:TetR/AcrR family transcriptional regulator, transcriptional repressor for nem operon